MKKKVYDYVEHGGKMYQAEHLTLECIGGCGKIFGPIVVPVGTKGEVECLRCRIKRTSRCQAKQSC